MAPRTAYRICFTYGFIVSPVSTLLELGHFPFKFTKEWERNFKNEINDLLANNLAGERVGMFWLVNAQCVWKFMYGQVENHMNKVSTIT